MVIEIRPITPDEWTAFSHHTARSFGETPRESWDRRVRPTLRYEDTQAAFDGDDLVGTLQHEPAPTTLPGGASLPCAGVTRASVAPTHRRRGILTGMMSRLLAQAYEAGNPLAALWASESPIYWRFGYGLATVHEDWTIERREAAFAPWAPPHTGSVRFISNEEALTVLPPLFDAVVTQRPGNSTRLPYRWEQTLDDEPEGREGRSPLYIVTYQSPEGVREGYATYRLKGAWPQELPAYELVVSEFVATTTTAEVELWRYLFGVDLVATVTAGMQPTDATLPWLLADFRRLRRQPSDGIYLRVMDVPAAFSARSYTAEARLVIEVPEDATCPWVAGRYAIDASSAGVEVSATSDSPQLVLHPAALGTLLLGTQPASVLGRAGLIAERAEDALAIADDLFRSPVAPLCLHHF